MSLRISYVLNSALEYREKNRIFGNIDNTIRKLSTGEIVSHEFDKVFTPERTRNLFDRDSSFNALAKDDTEY